MTLGQSASSMSRHRSISRDGPMSRDGMVLFIVAIVMGLVSLAAVGFMTSMRIEHRSARLQADQRQVEQIALSAETFLSELATAPRADRNAWGDLADNPALFRDIRVDLDPVGQRHGRFCIVIPRYADDSAEPIYHFGITSTSNRLSLATLLQWDRAIPGQGRTSLLQLPGMTEQTADALLDWIDADDVPREFGAESTFYLGLDPPRQPPNQPPQQLDQLLAVRGITEWQLFGRQVGLFSVRQDGNLGVDATSSSLESVLTTENAAAESWAVPGPPWSHLLCVDSVERNESAAGRPRIDLNQADLTQLESELREPFGEEAARFVVAWRQLGPSRRSFDSAQSNPLPAQSGAASGSFTFQTPLDLIDAVVEVPSAARSGDADGSSDDDRNGDESDRQRAYRSPFASRDPASLAKFVAFCDQTTAESSTSVRGRINVLTAPGPVLAAIPGITAEEVAAILTARQQPPDEGAAREHAVWLLTEDVVEVDTMKRLWPWVTVGGDLFEAQIVAFYDGQSPWIRRQVFIDGSRAEGQRVYCRDLRRLGRGFRLSEFVSPVTAPVANQGEPVSPWTPPTDLP